MWSFEPGTTSGFNDEMGGDYELNKMIQQPIDQYILSDYLDSPLSIPDSKLKRKAPDANRDQERKKEADRAYRQRCREKKIKNEENLRVLTEENNKLKRENGDIKKEEARLKEVVQAQNGFMKQLQDKFSHLKTQFDRQITLVDVLSKQLAMCKDTDRQLEVERLRQENVVLHRKISNRDSFNVIQLEAKKYKIGTGKKVPPDDNRCFMYEDKSGQRPWC